MSELKEVLLGIGVAEVADILMMTILVYGALAWMRARQMQRMTSGVLTVLALYLGARLFELELTATALEALLLVVLVAAIVLYGTEIRRLIERLFPFGARRQVSASTDDAEELSVVLFDLASRRVGALVVLAGRDDLAGVIEGGVELDGKSSEALMRSIFDSGSIGHDGAVVLRAGRVWRFACHLPLAAHALGSHRGTRHAAALGVSQKSDALAIAVSEERGTVTICERGELAEVDDPDALLQRLRAFRASHTGAQRGALKLPSTQPLTALAAVVVSALAWLIIVYGSRPMERSYEAEIQVTGVSPAARFQAIHPKRVVVRATGAGRDFVMASGRPVRVTLSLSGLQPGQHAVVVTAADVQLPRGLSLKAVEPSRISVSVVPR